MTSHEACQSLKSAKDRALGPGGIEIRLAATADEKAMHRYVVDTADGVQAANLSREAWQSKSWKVKRGSDN